MKLAIAAFLWSLVAEHGPDIPQAQMGLDVEQAVFQYRPHTPRRAFGAQRQALAVAVGKGVHLFLHDVSGVTDRALKNAGLLQNWQTNLLIAIGVQHASDLLLQLLPASAEGRHNVIHATNSA